MATKFQDKNEKLYQEIRDHFRKCIEKRGVDSNHGSRKVLKLKDEQQFNLDSGDYIVEVAEDVFLSKNGYEYYHRNLTSDQLCEIADNI